MNGRGTLLILGQEARTAASSENLRCPSTTMIASTPPLESAMPPALEWRWSDAEPMRDGISQCLVVTVTECLTSCSKTTCQSFCSLPLGVRPTGPSMDGLRGLWTQTSARQVAHDPTWRHCCRALPGEGSTGYASITVQTVFGCRLRRLPVPFGRRTRSPISSQLASCLCCATPFRHQPRWSKSSTINLVCVCSPTCIERVPALRRWAHGLSVIPTRLSLS